MEIADSSRHRTDANRHAVMKSHRSNPLAISDKVYCRECYTQAGSTRLIVGGRKDLAVACDPTPVRESNRRRTYPVSVGDLHRLSLADPLRQPPAKLRRGSRILSCSRATLGFRSLTPNNCARNRADKRGPGGESQSFPQRSIGRRHFGKRSVTSGASTSARTS
jgi:hypothetical protein